MNELDKLTRDGFSMDQTSFGASSLAFMALQRSLRAFFGTYKAMSFGLPDTDDLKVDHRYTNEYCLLCADAILSAHHFLELSIKEVLRSQHELLAADASHWPVALHKLLTGQSVSGQERERLRSTEFRQALERLLALVRADAWPNENLSIFTDNKSLLQKLNVLRNRLSHRGTFILHYGALDLLYVKHILPLLVGVANLPRFQEQKWRYRPTASGIDSIDELLTLGGSTKIDHQHVALLKEFGRAAYENPTYGKQFAKLLDEQHIERAKAAAQTSSSLSSVAEVRRCPVCGVESLSVYHEFDQDDPDPEHVTMEWVRTYEVQCHCCGFNITDDLKNPREYGYQNIRDYWTAKEVWSDPSGT